MTSINPAFFPSGNARPLVGRLFLPDEYESGRFAVVVLSHRFWQEMLKGDFAAIGKVLWVNGRSFTIVGVMPPRFDFPPRVDVWIPRVDR